MALAKSSESPLQNRLKIFVDDQKLKKLCVSTRLNNSLMKYCVCIYLSTVPGRFESRTF